MCGRAAQTSVAFTAFESSMQQLLLTSPSSSTQVTPTVISNETVAKTGTDQPNYNMSPGMDAVVFWNDAGSNKIQSGKKVWGLVTRGGTQTSPIPDGMGKHFEGLMFNARSDTLYEKPTFSKLARSGRTCLVALDGYFEWKSELKGRKQPYYVYRKNSENNDITSDYRPYLLIAGLWTTVPTGKEEDPVLDTFSMITTDVCNPLKWLHTRMPVIVWDEKLALDWLLNPSETILKRLEDASIGTPDNYLDWHAVTPDMTSMKFRSEKSIQPLPKMKTVKSFFSSTPTTLTKESIETKSTNLATNTITSTTPNKSTDTSGGKTVRTGSTNSTNFMSSTAITTIDQSPSIEESNRSPKKRSVSAASSPATSNNLKSDKKPKVGTLHSFFKPKT